MNLVKLNIPDLLIGLWHRDKKLCDKADIIQSWDWAVLMGNTWKQHRNAVGECYHHFPNSFDCPPRNIAEKINSRYKAWEFLMYLFGLAPVLLYGTLPDKFWTHFCKLVHGIRLIYQCRITEEELIEAHKYFIEFCEDYELLYYQCQVSCIALVCQAIYFLMHMVSESFCTGPWLSFSQRLIERMIGRFGGKIRQPFKLYVNFAQQGVCRSCTNAVADILSSIDPSTGLPRGAQELGNRFVLLPALERMPHRMLPDKINALKMYINAINADAAPGMHGEIEKVRRWTCLHLSTGQRVWAAWKEQKPLEQL